MDFLAMFSLEQVQGMLSVVVVLGLFCGVWKLFNMAVERLDEWFFNRTYARTEMTKALAGDRQLLANAKAENEKLKKALKGKVDKNEHNQQKDAKVRAQQRATAAENDVKGLESKLRNAEEENYRLKTQLDVLHGSSYRPQASHSGQRAPSGGIQSF